jgi:outer membrane lipoprotein-sorting protein
MTVDKKTFLPTKIEFINKNGKVQKVLTNGSIEKIDGYWTPKEMTMENRLNGHKTVMILSEVRHNVGLKSSIFTKRYLKRSE